MGFKDPDGKCFEIFVLYGSFRLILIAESACPEWSPNQSHQILCGSVKSPPANRSGAVNCSQSLGISAKLCEYLESLRIVDSKKVDAWIHWNHPIPSDIITIQTLTGFQRVLCNISSPDQGQISLGFKQLPHWWVSNYGMLQKQGMMWRWGAVVTCVHMIYVRWCI